MRKQHRLDKQNCLLVNAIIVSYFLSAISRMIRCLILAANTTLQQGLHVKNAMLPNEVIKRSCCDSSRRMKDTTGRISTALFFRQSLHLHFSDFTMIRFN